MDDEFALCWNNFQDNIASGFQNLYDRGDLVDVTLACDGKLLHAHKIVLAICSPYFQEMFITNPCKHPIIVLKDVSYSVMIELLQFMYQGVVNVKHTELSTFMKIAQTLQIKGLATSSGHQKSPSLVPPHGSIGQKPAGTDNSQQSASNVIETKISTTPYNKSNAEAGVASVSSAGQKRGSDFGMEQIPSGYIKKQHKRSSESIDHHDQNSESTDPLSCDDSFMTQIPQISMIESSRYDLNAIKREASAARGGDLPSPGSLRNSLPTQFNFDYNMYQKPPAPSPLPPQASVSSASSAAATVEYPNELKMTNDYSKGGAGNHMDIPQGGSNITMLSSTSLLHGNCIFNRNNTVATQQGMKTYWLCKSYRITMCRARCITHQGRVISATGVHNHSPHIKSPNGNDYLQPLMSPSVGGVGGLGTGTTASGGHGSNPGAMLAPSNQNPPNMRIPQPTSLPHHINAQQQQHTMSMHPSIQGHHHNHHHHHHQTMHQSSNVGGGGGSIGTSQNAAVIQNMMHNVLSQNANLMHLSNMAPMLNSPSPSAHHSALGSISIHPPSGLQITPVQSNSNQHHHQSGVHHSPVSRNNNNHGEYNQIDSPDEMQHAPSAATIEMTSPSSAAHSNQQQQHSNMPLTTITGGDAGVGAVSSSTNSTPTGGGGEAQNFPSSIASSSHHQDSSNGSHQSNIVCPIDVSPAQQNFKMEHMN